MSKEQTAVSEAGLQLQRPVNIGDIVAIDETSYLLADGSVVDRPKAIEIAGDRSQVRYQNLDQYFGPWAVHEPTFQAMVNSLQGFNLDIHLRQQVESGAARQEEGLTIVRGNLALVSINGTMTKRGSSLSGGGTIQARREIRQAVRSDSVSGILLAIESPGGTVAGTKELADEVASAAQQKPVHAYIEDIGASAAYYVASQAGRISANAPAFIGSIGTFMVVYDASANAEQLGIKVHVISTGPFKGAGVPGAKVTDEQLANWQELIYQSNELFLDAVAAGRKLSRATVNKLADGRVHLASVAKDLNLIDSVGSMSEALDTLQAEIGKTTSGDQGMSNTQPTATLEVKQATPQEIRAACPGASADFVLEQYEKGATVQQAQTAFIADQQKQVEAARAEAEEAKAKAAKSAASIPGNDPHQSDSSSDDGGNWTNPRQVWETKMREKISLGIRRDEAAVQLNSEFPGLREAMLDSFHPNPKKDLA